MFNWLFRKTQTDDVYKIAILDRETDIRHLPYKLAVFYHSFLYSKLVEIIESIYGGYNGDIFHFLPPIDYLSDLYQRVRYAFMQIDRRPEFRDLRIMDFKVMPSLFDNHHRLIKNWEEFRTIYSKDKKTLLKNVIQQYPLSNDVRVAFNDIDKLLIEHCKCKKEFLSDKDKRIIKYNEMTLNLKRGTLQFKDIDPIDINPTNQEIKLLILLLKYKDSIVLYENIAKKLDISSRFSGHKEEVKGALKIIKNKLNKSLNKAGFRKNIIKSVRGSGYILNSMLLK